MSDWNELFGVREETIEQKKPSIPVKKSTKKHPQTTYTSVIPEGSRITKDDLEILQNNILEAMNHMIPEGLEQHHFSREKLIQFIGSCGLRGTKLYELKFFFYPTPASTIAEELDKLKAEGLLQSNRNGWKTLTKKGLELAEKLK